MPSGLYLCHLPDIIKIFQTIKKLCWAQEFGLEICSVEITRKKILIDWLCLGLTTRQPLRVILCRLPEKGRKEIEEIVEEMKERDREERGTGMKVKKQKK